MGVNERLDEPFLTRAGGSAAGSDGAALPVSIDGRSYLIDTSRNAPMQERFRRQTVQLLNSQQNIDKGESALTTPEVWRRSYQSWHHGMGQRFADREDSNQYRYDWSKGINPWERWELSLLHETKKINPDQMIEALVANGCTVMLSGSRLSMTVVPPGGAETAGDPVEHPQSIIFDFPFTMQHWIATDGYLVYALGSDKMLRVYSITVAPHPVTGLPTPTVTMTAARTIGIPAGESIRLLLMLNYKLIACTSAGKVYDITAGISADLASPPVAYTSPTPNVQFIAGCSGKRAVYLMTSTGLEGKTFIHAFDIVRTTTGGSLDTLTYGGVAAELPDGEKGHALHSYLGYVAIGTDKGFRFAAVGDGIVYGPLIETPKPVTAFEGQGRFLYYALAGWHGTAGVGRADMSTFTASLQPAYAADIMCAEDFDDTVTFIITDPNGRMRFGTTSNGVWEEQETYVDQGQIVMSGWTFNVIDPKVGLYVTTQTSSGTGGGGSLLALYNSSTTEIPLGSFITADQKFELSGVTFNAAALVCRLTPNAANTATPKIYGLELRSTYARGKASEWQVPCILHDEIEMDNGTVIARDVIEDYDHLMSLYESGRAFQYVEDGRVWTVNATDFIWSPQERSVRSGWQGVYTLYFREIR